MHNTLSYMYQFCRRAGLVFVVLGVAAAGLLLIQWRQHHMMALSVQSNSMQPLFSKGDALVIIRTEPTLIRTGDIVSYPDPLHPAVTISHRVIEVDTYTGRLVTKGDANASPDPATSILAVNGVVHYAIPYMGVAIDMLRSWLGIIAFVYIPAALAVLNELRRLARDYLVPTYALRR